MLRLMKGKKPADIVGSVSDDKNPGEEPITLAIDSAGLTTTNRGSYIEDKWKTGKRKFLKLHILADKKKDRQDS
jgi:hypothetical protein